MSAGNGDVRLGAYPAKRCPRVVHNLYAPGEQEPRPLSTTALELIEGGRAFEESVAVALRLALAERLVEIAPGQHQAVQERQTLAAMEAGAEVILGGRLPAVGPRVGAPDVLVRLEGGYAPVDIKQHHTSKEAKRGELRFSTLAEPSIDRTRPGRSNRGGHRGDDTMQIAHYARMLADLGHGADGHRGGIIGTDAYAQELGSAYAITWYDLAEPVERTYSASAETRRRTRSALERYDHEFGFRVKVAEAAARGEELVRPIGTEECTDCEWAEHCARVAGPEDASFAIEHGRLRVREWQFLASRGVTSVGDLAGLEITEPLLDDFTVQAASRTGRKSAEKMLRAAVERARMVRDGIAIELRGAAPALPAADVEIDLDIEWDRAGLIYQWGLRVREDRHESGARYHPAVSFETLDAVGEAALAEVVADRLEEIVGAAVAAGRSVGIYHWSSVEITRTRGFPRIQALLAEHAFDLMAWFEEHFRVRGSYSIKSVAAAFGFAWAVEDAGGFTSLDRIETARGLGPEADEARRWCLTYNEADVEAQAVIRDGIAAILARLR